MELVQKLPACLGVVCLLMLGSCSKDEALLPEPKVEVASADTTANMKTSALPWICGTKGFPGANVLPNFWERRWLQSGDPAKYPYGTSSFQKLWGSVEWKGPFKPILTTWNSIVTVTTATENKTNYSKLAKVGTTIRFLEVGRKYKLTFYIASARPMVDVNGNNPSFVKRCHIAIKSPNDGQAWQNQSWDFDMMATPHKWLKKTIEFKATNDQMRFDFSATSLNEGMMAYAHLYMEPDAIWKVN